MSEKKIEWNKTDYDGETFYSAAIDGYSCNISPHGFEIFYNKDGNHLCYRGGNIEKTQEDYKKLCEDFINNDEAKFNR